MKPLLMLLLGGAAIGAGVVLYRRRRAAASSGASSGTSSCEVACVAAARAAGVTGDLGALCKSGCGLVSGVVSGGKRAVTGTVTRIADGLGFGSDGPGFCSGCCPEGTTPKFTHVPHDGTGVPVGGDQLHILDHRQEAEGAENVWGAVCIDGEGKIVGTLTDRFNPISFGTITPPKPSTSVNSTSGTSKLGYLSIAPTKTEGSTSTGLWGFVTVTPTTSTAPGGVTVTSSGMTREEEAAAQEAAALEAKKALLSFGVF